MFEQQEERKPPIGVLRSEDFPPASPIERELGKAVASLRESFGVTDKNFRESNVQTIKTQWIDMQTQPVGYEVPKIFVRALSEAVEQAIITYCPGLVDRETGMLYLLNQVAEYVNAPRHLYFETFEPNPTWYDYMRITVMDCITGSPIGTADIIPPTTSVIIANVNVPLFDSTVVTADSVPHLPQVELTFLKYSDKTEEKNPVVAQSLTVPLELFTKSSSILCHLWEVEEREVSYRAVLVRKATINEMADFPIIQ